jgi:hypothetical protein
MSDKTFNYLTIPLIEYACSKFNEMSIEKYIIALRICETIRCRISDLHSRVKFRRDRGLAYFGSDEFEYHCDCLYIPPSLMLYIAANPPKHSKYNKKSV